MDYYKLQVRIIHSSELRKLNENLTFILTLHFVLQWTYFHLRQSQHPHFRENRGLN